MMPATFVIGRRASHAAVLLLCLSATLLLCAPAAVRATSSTGVDYDEEDYWWDTQEYTELWNHVEARRWSKAVARVKSHPDEASVLVLRRERTGRVYEKSLPLHKAFAVDVVEDARPLDAPPADGSEVPSMPGGQIELVDLLLTKHPDAAKVVDAEERLPLHLAAYSSVSPPPPLLRRLIDAYPGALDRPDGNRKLPLHAACSAPLSSHDLVKALADARPEAVRSTDKDGALPIHLASWAGGRRGPDVARTFELLHGAHPGGVRARDGDGDTALMIMVKYGRTAPDALEFVLGADPDGPAAERRRGAGEEASEEEPKNGTGGDPEEGSNATDGGGGGDEGTGDTVLHGALMGPGHDGTADMVGRLLAARPDLAGAKNAKGKLPLHILLDHCCASLDAVKVLAGSHEDGVRTVDGNGRLPLHHACREGVDDPEIVRFLLETYPESAEVADGSSALPLHLAIDAPSGRSDEDEHGATPMDYVISILVDAYPAGAGIPNPRNDLLPLHAALRRHKSPLAIRRLIEAHPASVRTPAAGTNGSTALHLLAEERDEYRPDAVGDVLDALLSSYPEGATTADDAGRLPLHAACRPAREVPPRRRREREREAAARNATAQEVMTERLLRSHAGGAAARDGGGNLPLHYACMSHSEKVVLALLDAHPDGAAAVSDDSGLIPLQIACGALRPKYELYEKGKAVDAIVGRLLEVYPEGAAASGGKEDNNGGGGGLPLHIVSASAALSPHLANETVLALIAANPPAVRAKDGEGNLPLHNSIRCRPHDTGRSTVLIRSLLREYPEAASEGDSRGDLPLHIALTHARGGSKTGSTYRRISKLLLDAYPDAVTAKDSVGRLPAHRVAKILGETGGTGRDMPGWAALLREVVERNRGALTEPDDRGRTPLHCLCFALSDAVLDLAEAGKAPKTSSETMEALFVFLLTEGPGALDVEDGGGNRPRDMVENDRQLGHLGEDRGELSATFTALKREIKRGYKFWKTAATANREPEVEAENESQPKTGSDEL